MAQFQSREVQLSDQFQQRTVEIFKAVQFCNAVDKNGEGILNPSAHLTCYEVRRAVTIQPQVVLTDQFGQLERDIRRGRSQLCVPTTEMGFSSAPAAKSIPAGPDHYEFYKIKRTAQTERFEPREVGLEDQFIDETVRVKKPVRLGVPTDKNDEGIIDSESHLTCYNVRASQFQKRDVEIVNQFGEFRLRLKKPNMLCVPSEKQVVSEPD